jgi:hypothetical protein
MVDPLVRDGQGPHHTWTGVHLRGGSADPARRNLADVRRLLSLRPIVIAVAVLALAAGACSQDKDVTEARFASDLRERARNTEDEATMTVEESKCFAGKVFDEYDQAEINRIYTAATEDELTNERRDELLVLAGECGIEPPAAPAEESTTTTEADPEE